MSTPLLHESWHDLAPPCDELPYMPMQHMNRILDLAARLLQKYYPSDACARSNTFLDAQTLSQ
jgi:hypothetical protein